MSTFQENLTILQNLLRQSAGKPVHYGNETYRFTQQAKVTEEELANFEQQYNVRLPEDFKTFLLTLGACTLFEDERGFSYQFYAPEQWESYAKEVFEGTGGYLFPHILLVCYPNVCLSLSGLKKKWKFVRDDEKKYKSFKIPRL